MRMNKTCYKQYDTRWASLPYPKKPWLIKNCGCGEVSICNAIIDMEQYKNQTPKTIQPYMKQFAESRGNGTYHSGIPAAMKHYGMTEVKEHATMAKLWAELRKGGRNAVLLMGKKEAGSKHVKWTGCGHFIEVSGFKEEGGMHWVYVKDSASTSSYRNGWITYEGNIRGACLKCWSGKLNGKMADTPSTPTVEATPDGKLTIDGVGGTSTVKAMQRFFGTTQDGVITGQNQACSKYYPALKAVKYGKGGSTCVKHLQRWLGITEDGVWGKGTSTALQKKLKVHEDGIFGADSMKAWQKYLNENDKAVYPEKKEEPKKDTPKAESVADKIYKKIVEYAWPCGTASKKWVYKTGSAKKAYRTALKKQMGYTSKVARSDCGYFVDTILRALGYKDALILKGSKQAFPSVPKGFKIAYRGKTVPDDYLKRGDIVRYKKTKGSQHTYIVVDSTHIAEAGVKTRFPVIRKLSANSKCNASNVKHSTIQVIRSK